MNKNKITNINVDSEHFDNGASVYINLTLENSMNHEFDMYLSNAIRDKGKETKHWHGLDEVSFWAESDNKCMFISFACLNSEAEDFKDYFDSKEFEKLVNDTISSFLELKYYTVDFTYNITDYVYVMAKNKEEAEKEAKKDIGRIRINPDKIEILGIKHQ